METELDAGDVWRNEPGQVHTIEALEDAVVVEVSTPDLDDVVRLTDDYGRANAQRRSQAITSAAFSCGGKTG